MGRARDRASADLNGQEFILDADADTSISADTDDQIDIKIAGADDFQFTANTFTAQSGSTIAAQALTATTITASGVVDITDTTDSSDATGDTGALRTEGGASIAKKLYVGTDLDVDGTANLDAVDIDGDVNVDSKVFNIDSSNDLVGINTNTIAENSVAKLTINVDNAGGLIINNTGQTNGEYASMFFAAHATSSANAKQGIGVKRTGDFGVGDLVFAVDSNADNAAVSMDNDAKMTITQAGHVTKPSSAMWWAHDTSNNNAANSTNDAYETFIFDSETYDIGSGYNTSNGRYVAPVAGKYYVSSKLLVQGLNINSAYYIDIAIFVNGAQKLRESNDLNTYARAQTMSVSGLVHCDASDYIEVKIRFENVSNQVVYAAQTTAYFQGFLVG